MKINRQVALILSLSIVSACSAERGIVPRPAPTQGTATRPVVAPPAPAPSAAPSRPTVTQGEWRDAPITPGTWTYAAAGSATSATFTSPQGAALFAMTCHRERGAVTLTRAGRAAGPVPATLMTTFGMRQATFATLSPTDATLDLSLPARDPRLDELAFSRGRIGVEVNGLPTLYLPAWAEIGRVIEDCR